MIRRTFSRLLVVACLSAAHPPGAAAQCFIETETEFDSPLTDQPGTTGLKSTGTIVCPGLFEGTLCASGSLTGTCSQNTNGGYVVTCHGPCNAQYGNTSGSVSCELGATDENSRGVFSQECVRGVCRSQGSGTTGTNCGVSVVDPGELLNGLENCGGAGVTTSASHGAVLVVCPQ